ncbi:MAG: hypothetical protein IPJ30_25660 [Acidobacteria bacterium]|nr:hypothetical protein [Acidobacteriota bacterium]
MPKISDAEPLLLVIETDPALVKLPIVLPVTFPMFATPELMLMPTKDAVVDVPPTMPDILIPAIVLP